jgi:hypothetical protein
MADLAPDRVNGVVLPRDSEALQMTPRGIGSPGNRMGQVVGGVIAGRRREPAGAHAGRALTKFSHNIFT